MILGGVNAAGKAGGMVAGYSECYLPCSANIINETVKSAIEQTEKHNIQYVSYFQVRNVANTAWVTVSAASYFQVTHNASGQLDSSDVTLQKPEIWSQYKDTYPDLLAPSTRLARIRSGLKINGTNYLVTVFNGHIKDYSEYHGGRGGSISLRLEDARDILTRAPSVSVGLEHATAYRLAQAMAKLSTVPGMPRSFTFAASDMKYVTGQTSVNWESIKNSVPGFAVTNIKNSTSISLGSQTNVYGEGIPAFSYNDANGFVLTRRAGDAQFNVVRCYGLKNVSGVTRGVIEEVQDDADVAKRGRIVYAAGLVGSPTITIEEAKNYGRAGLANSLLGTADFEIPYNPYIRSGTLIQVQSNKGSIETSIGYVNQYRHQYAVGRARTYISNLQFTPET